MLIAETVKDVSRVVEHNVDCVIGTVINDLGDAIRKVLGMSDSTNWKRTFLNKNLVYQKDSDVADTLLSSLSALLPGNA